MAQTTSTYVDDWGDSPPAANTKTPAAPPPSQESPLHSFLRNAVRGAGAAIDPRTAGEAIKLAGKTMEQQPWFKAAADVATIPAEGLANVFGYGERINSALLTESLTGKNPRGAAEAAAALYMPGETPLLVDPAARAAMVKALYATFHPNDPNIEAGSERAVHLDKILSTDPRFRGKAWNFGVRTIFQMLKDPTTFAGAGAAAVGEHILEGADAFNRAAMISRNPVVRTTSRVLSPNVDEKVAQSENAIKAAKKAGTYTDNFRGDLRAVQSTLKSNRKAIAAVNSARNKGIATIRKMSESDDALVAKHIKEIKAVPVTALENASYTVKPNMVATTVGGKTRWIPKGSRRTVNPVWNNEIEQRLNLGRPKLEKDRYLDPNRSATEASDPESVLRNHLAESRKLVARNVVFDQLKKNTSKLAPEELEALRAPRDPSKKPLTSTEILKRVADVDPAEAGPSVLRSISDAQIDAMLATGAPHMRNVGVAGLMAMPPQDVAKAAFWAAFNRTPKALKQRLEEGGGQSHFGLGEARSPIVRALEQIGPGKVKPARWWRGFTGKALDRWDEALRGADLQGLDKRMGSAEEFEKMDRVNQDLGAYGIKPQWTTFAPLVGANFPQWHGYIVPTMFARTALRRPQALANMGRAETNFNDQIFPDEGYRWTLGGPGDEGMSAAMDPVRTYLLGKYPSYFGGQSTAGALSVLRPSFKTPTERLTDYLAGFVPFGNVLDDTANAQFPEIPAWPQAAAQSMGFYPQKRTTSSYIRTSPPTLPPLPMPTTAAPAAATAAPAAAAAPSKGGYVDDWSKP